MEDKLSVGHTDFWFIHSELDFETKACHKVESFYDCFSGEEKLINQSRYPDFVIEGEPSKPNFLTIKKTVEYAGKFYITHVIEDTRRRNRYANRW